MHVDGYISGTTGPINVKLMHDVQDICPLKGAWPDDVIKHADQSAASKREILGPL